MKKYTVFENIIEKDIFILNAIMATMKTMNLLPGFNEDFPKDPLDLGKIFDTERKIFYVRSDFITCSN